MNSIKGATAQNDQVLKENYYNCINIKFSVIPQIKFIMICDVKKNTNQIW